MNKGMKTLIGIPGIAGIVLIVFGCINLYAASVQEKMAMAAVALSVVILLGLILLIRQARRQNLKGKQAVVLIGLGCLVPEIVSLVCEWSSVESFFIWNISFVALSMALAMAAMAAFKGRI